MQVHAEEQLVASWLGRIADEQLVQCAQVVVHVRVLEAQQRDAEAVEQLLLEPFEVGEQPMATHFLVHDLSERAGG